jgi:hypothetical protein
MGREATVTRGASTAAKATAIEQLHLLLKADLAGETQLRHESIHSIHWRLARVASVVTADTAQVPFQHATTKCVDLRAVQRFRTEVGRFLTTDSLFAAGHDREALIAYLVANIRRLTRGDYSEQVGRALYSAIAEAILLLTWLTFNVAPTSALTQAYSVSARQFAHRGGDRLLETAALAAMSEQARYMGIADDAAELAAAVLRATVDGDPRCLKDFDGSQPVAWQQMLTEIWAVRSVPRAAVRPIA